MNHDIPIDYRPRESIQYFAVFLDVAKGVFMLEDAEAGRIFKQLYKVAAEYSQSYDANIEIDADGLSILGKYIGDQLASGVKRAEDSRRSTSYNRSKQNGGGRPNKT